MHQNKICGMLGICRKAGKLVAGTDLVVEAIRSRKNTVQLVLLSADASENTVKKVRNCCKHYGKTLLILNDDGEQIARIIGKTGVISTCAICDSGLAKALMALITTNNESEEQREENG